MSHTTSVWLKYELHHWLRPSRKPDLVAKYRDALCEGVLERLGVALSITDDRVSRSDKGQLIVANHGSALDILIMLKLFGGVMVSRGDVAEWAVLGTLAKHGDTIFVNREDGWSGALAMRSIRRALQNGKRVMLFPEGSTFDGDEVRDFQPGAFAAARGLDATILPVGIAYEPFAPFVDQTFIGHAYELAGCGSILAAISIGEEVVPGGKSRALAGEVQGKVQDMVSKSRQRLAKNTE